MPATKVKTLYQNTSYTARHSLGSKSPNQARIVELWQDVEESQAELESLAKNELLFTHPEDGAIAAVEVQSRLLGNNYAIVDIRYAHADTIFDFAFPLPPPISTGSSSIERVEIPIVDGTSYTDGAALRMDDAGNTSSIVAQRRVLRLEYIETVNTTSDFNAWAQDPAVGTVQSAKGLSEVLYLGQVPTVYKLGDTSFGILKAHQFVYKQWTSSGPYTTSISPYADIGQKLDANGNPVLSVEEP